MAQAIQPNPLFSKQGFFYLIDTHLSRRFHFSQLELNQMINSLTDTSMFTLQKNIHSSRLKRKEMRKKDQVEGVANLVSNMGNYKRVLEVGSGSGELAFELARNPSYEITALDINQDLTNKNSSRANSRNLSNLTFKTQNAYEYNSLNTETDLVVSLHGCGNLTDRAIDLAIESDADIVSVPCCYGKIKTSGRGLSLPRSSQLKGHEEFFKGLLKKVLRLEGETLAGKQTQRGMLRDIYRILANFDRIFTLQENNYQVAISPMTRTHCYSDDGKEYANSSLRYAILGKKFKD